MIDFESILGNEKTKELLFANADKGRISHAQIVEGNAACAPLSFTFAYAQKLLSLNNPQGKKQMESLSHPDLFLFFPNASTESIKADKVESRMFLPSFRQFVLENPFGELSDWEDFVGLEKKQVSIHTKDAETLIKDLSLKSYSGGYKVVILWRAEYLNESASNKILKILEEPPENTLFLLVVESSEELLPTITSRCQTIVLKPLEKHEVIENLQRFSGASLPMAENAAEKTSHQISLAVNFLRSGEIKKEFQEVFVSWVRLAFVAKKNVSALKDLVAWSAEISTWGREKQKLFLEFCLDVFRSALLQNYQLEKIAPKVLTLEGFNWQVFSTYVHGANILEIIEEIQLAHFHIERNVNAKMVFLDGSIQLTRFLHKKSE